MSDVNCHKCGKIYSCELGEDQGLCPYCKTKLAESLPPGSQIKDNNNIVWIRMSDSITHHLEGFYFNPQDGNWKHASRIIYKGTCFVPCYPDQKEV